MESAVLLDLAREDARVKDLLARTFVISFMLVYATLVIALVAWNVRNSLASSAKKGMLRDLFERFQHLHLPHRPRNAH